EEMEGFLRKHCGLADPTNRCRCAKLVATAVATGVVDPQRLVLDGMKARQADRLRVDIEEMRTAAQVFRSLPSYESPTDFAAKVREWLDAGDGDGPRDTN